MIPRSTGLKKIKWIGILVLRPIGFSTCWKRICPATSRISAGAHMHPGVQTTTSAVQIACIFPLVPYTSILEGQYITSIDHVPEEVQLPTHAWALPRLYARRGIPPIYRHNCPAGWLHVMCN